MQSPEAREYDGVETPDSGSGKRRNFGVRRRKFGGTDPSVVENAHDGRSHTETAAFQHVRRNSVLGARRQVHAEEFDFGDTADHTRRNGHSTSGNGHSGSGKYSQQPRITIRPGASLMRPSASAPSRPPPMNEEEQRLRQLRLPPGEITGFMSNILKLRKPSASSGGATRVPVPVRPVAKRAAGSLESASAPTKAPLTTKKPLPVTSGHDGWTAPTRLLREASSPSGSKRARVDLTPTQARRTPISTKDSGFSSKGPTRTSARILHRPTRDTFGMYDDDNVSSSSASVASRYAKKDTSRASNEIVMPSMRRSTRSSPKPKDGTEDMPIHLSDSDEDEDDASPSGQEQGASTDDQSEAVGDADMDMAAVRKESLVDFQAMRAWFGECACRIDVYVGKDYLWLCSVKGVESTWSLEKNYRIALHRVKSVLLYRWTPDQVDTFDTSDPAGKVMATTSFIALQFPIPSCMRKSEWRKFYDPDADESSAKRYLLLLARNEDKDATILGTVEDMIRNRHRRVHFESLNTLDEVRPLAKTMIERDHHYAFRDRPRSEDSRRSRRRRETDEDATQLTYPLPPCTVDLVTITRQDISRLQPAEYLNDNIIDYYLKRLLIVDYASDELVKQNVLFLSSHFYSRLRAGKGVSMKERLAAGYKNVSTWLTRSDLFSRALVFVPINKDLHWSLAVIINPKCAGKIDDSDDDASPQTCIALLDPLGSYHSSIPILRNLKSFLEFEWERVSGVNSYEPAQISKIQVKAPRQTNSFDCGVFVLKYAQEMLANFSKLLGSVAEDKKTASGGFLVPRAITDDGVADLIPQDAFTAHDVTNKRKEIQAMLDEDTKRYEAILDGKTDAKSCKAEA